MNEERFDRLLDQALDTGVVPAEATPEERRQIEDLLTGAGRLRASARVVLEEASASMPTARARFQQHMANERTAAAAASVPAARVAARERRRGFAGVLAWHRGLTSAGTAAAIGVLALVAVFVSQNALNGTESAAAQVLNPGDYVQVQGTVLETTGERMKVQSEFGDFEVDLSGDTSVLDDEAEQEASHVKPGDTVRISGLVQNNRRVSAQTLALSSDEQGLPPKEVTLQRLKDLRPNLAGKVTQMTVAKDGTHGQVLIETDRGERFLVKVDAASIGDLVQQFSTALGANVSVAKGDTAGTFRLQVNEGSKPEATPAGPRFTDVRGVVTSRQGINLQVRTDRGALPVVIRPETRIIVLADAGITVEQVRSGQEVVGHGVSITGGLVRDKAVADLIVVGPAVAR